MYQLAKSYNYGVNTCQQCLAKQREIDRLTEENQRLRAKLSQQKRKDQEGFFGSSTPSAQIPVKPIQQKRIVRSAAVASPATRAMDASSMRRKKSIAFAPWRSIRFVPRVIQN